MLQLQFLQCAKKRAHIHFLRSVQRTACCKTTPPRGLSNELARVGVRAFLIRQTCDAAEGQNESRKYC